MIVYTGGTFDLFHPGHVELLKQCSAMAQPWNGGKVIVALNTDEFVAAYKRIIPTHDYAARKRILEACRYVDLVICNTGGADSKVAIEVIRPDIIAIGEDWRSRDYNAQMGFTDEWLKERHIRVEYINHLRGFSSTNVREALAHKP